MKKVFICSPFRAGTSEQRHKNLSNAINLCRLAIKDGCAPFAPHLLYPQMLDDNNMQERDTGIEAGIAFLEACHEIWILHCAPTEGMQKEIEHAAKKGLKIVWKSLEA